ncbi:hypothetical protein [Chitinophaga nivalis]|uniref:DUF3887 domain-containing protein n=1 Tax=Chitinophaga nivalis TaxID=2991709 RepID=A0ABT3IJF2_9BACT|nr:hypothetical protein [Chitinophaga nivalis]MCW3466231.1 hypothetical protein [Chitinophaga nivalis]MCW3484078.1 hypothetical protein [Chitinophaga nivalis]
MMKKNRVLSPCILLTIAGLLWTNHVSGQRDFAALPASPDSTYGYTADHPLKLKMGTPAKSAVYAQQFLSGLRTADQQYLLPLFRKTVADPHIPKLVSNIRDRYTEVPIDSKPGLLDKYVYLTSVTKDTITLFIDLYHKGNLLLPAGLEFKTAYE